MNFEDIEVDNKYMVYEDNVGEVAVIAKAIVHNRALVWYQTKDAYGIGEAKYLSPIPLDKREAVRKVVNDLQFVLSRTLETADDIEQSVIDIIDDLIYQIEEGIVVWHIGSKKE